MPKVNPKQISGFLMLCQRSLTPFDNGFESLSQKEQLNLITQRYSALQNLQKVCQGKAVFTGAPRIKQHERH